MMKCACCQRVAISQMVKISYNMYIVLLHKKIIILFRDDLGKFEFLTQCIKEGMRLHSPVPLISRESTKEFTLEGITFPPGTFFGINIYGLHHNPAVWTDPTKFDPDRFSKDNATKMDSFAFTPFSAGPRYS